MAWYAIQEFIRAHEFVLFSCMPGELDLWQGVRRGGVGGGRNGVRRRVRADISSSEVRRSTEDATAKIPLEQRPTRPGIEMG